MFVYGGSSGHAENSNFLVFFGFGLEFLLHLHDFEGLVMGRIGLCLVWLLWVGFGGNGL